MEEREKYKTKQYFDNARLAVDLAIELGARGTDAGSMSNFSKVAPGWSCPGCGRTKGKIARLNRHGEFYCALHLHHDHLPEQVCEMLGIDSFLAPGEFMCRLHQNSRFSEEFICMDCNRVDAQAKRLLDAPRHFSFSAEEMRGFVIAAPRVSHKIDAEKAKEMFSNALLQFNDLAENLSDSISRYDPDLLMKARSAAKIRHDRWECWKIADR